MDTEELKQLGKTIEDAIKGNAEFFAPLHMISPIALFGGPLIINFSINYFFDNTLGPTTSFWF